MSQSQMTLKFKDDYHKILRLNLAINNGKKKKS